jgi:dihydrofolate reductase
MPPFKAIAAMAQNRVIGFQNRIPWHFSDDFKWFKQTTLGNTLLMGRKTYESIGRPLPGRTTLVLSRGEIDFPGTTRVANWRTIPQELVTGTIFVAGGAEVYSQTLPYCSDLYLTHVKQTPEGDTFFPKFENRFSLVETVRETAEFSILHYHNPSPLALP